MRGRIFGVDKKTLKKLFITSFVLLATPGVLWAGGIDWASAHNKVYEYQEESFFKVKNSTNPHDYYTYAVYMLTLKKNKEAEDMFIKARHLSENSFEPLWGLAEIKRRRGQVEESTDILDSIIRSHGDFAPAKISRAYIYFEEGEYTKAINLASEVLDKENKADKANIIRAHLIIGGAKGMAAQESFIIGKIAKGLSARRHLSKARDIDPNHPGVLLAWGTYYLEAPSIAGGSMDKAEEYLLEALERAPNMADVHARLGQLYLEKNRKDKYYEHLEKARRLAPASNLVQEVQSMGEAFYE